jgi:hypothetical protein
MNVDTKAILSKECFQKPAHGVECHFPESYIAELKAVTVWISQYFIYMGDFRIWLGNISIGSGYTKFQHKLIKTFLSRVTNRTIFQI